MNSDIDIASLALSHLGVDKTISNFDENSAEARALDQVYDLARDATLRDFAWPFAKRFVDLTLVEEDPVSIWGYSYRYPNDCVDIRRIVSAEVMDNEGTEIPYDLGHDANGVLIYTNQEDAVLEYTGKCETASFYPADFALAFSFRLATLVAPRLSHGKAKGLGDSAYQQYLREIAKAKASALNEVKRGASPMSSLERARE